MMLPKLDGISPRLMDGFAQVKEQEQLSMAIAANVSPRLLIRTRQTRRPVPLPVRRAARHLWRADVKRWCEVQEKAVDLVQRNPREEQAISEWFSALDLDRSNSVEEDEVAAMMTAMGVTPDPKTIAKMFASIGKPVTARLSRADFVKFVTINADKLTNPTFTSAGGGLFDPNTRLMMMAYRRQRLIEEAQDPANRRASARGRSSDPLSLPLAFCARCCHVAA